MVKTISTTVLKYIIAFFVLAIVFTLLITLVALIPNERVQRNIIQSLPQFEEEGDGYVPFSSKRSMLDVGTDMHMAQMSFTALKMISGVMFFPTTFMLALHSDSLYMIRFA